MSNNYFKFRRFTVWQDRCAMKVGTDGTLLGAWAVVPQQQDHTAPRVLDIGTGTGLVALMMAQRYDDAQVLGIDIDCDAVSQARENVARSPFSDRINIQLADLDVLPRLLANSGTSSDGGALSDGDWRRFSGHHFDAIVSNPPFFQHALLSPDRQRSLARHTDTLPYRLLMERAWTLLADEGLLSVIIPFDCKDALLQEAVLAGFSLVRQCAVKTTSYKPPRRYLLAFAKRPAAIVEQTELVIGDDRYVQLTKDFYQSM